MKSAAITILSILVVITFSKAQFPEYTFTNNGIDKGYFFLRLLNKTEWIQAGTTLR